MPQPPPNQIPPNQPNGLGWQMNGLAWIDPAAASLLDLGCNVGELLGAAAQLYPRLKLAGVDVNRAAIETARSNLAQADLRQCDGPMLPFAENSFDHVTCIEVLEHIPQPIRRATLGEVWRVLKPGGRFILRCPHAGIFQGLDPSNLRFRLPRLHRTIIRRGLRDHGYRDDSAGVIWHHHFSRDELLDLAGPGFELEAERYGGLLLMPLGDLMRWPFYRLKLYRNPVLRLIDRVISWDLGIDYGRASFTILLVMRKIAPSTNPD
jgi:SAM-dependent methyltransferase